MLAVVFYSQRELVRYIHRSLMQYDLDTNMSQAFAKGIRAYALEHVIDEWIQKNLGTSENSESLYHDS